MSLPLGEREVLKLAAKGLLRAISETHRYAETVIAVECAGHSFTAKGKTVLVTGWKSYEQEQPEAVSTLPDVTEQQSLSVSDAAVKTGKTTPPKHFTEDTLLSAMESAGKEDMPDDAERKGIGTPATRSGIIEKLVSSGFVERKKSKKAVNLLPTSTGTALITVIDLITTLFMREQSGRKECFFMPKFIATAYIRLSYTDDRSSESDSVSNQRRLIENFVERNPDIEVVSEKIDDGYSGIIFDRPAFKEMMQDITDGNINCVIVKDLSRLGREYIETGRYLRRVFPAYGVRFIAITDNIDTAHDSSGDDLTVSVKNIMNEAYCRDISIKTRTSLDVKRRNGDFVGAFTVYGYMKSEDNKNQLVPDPYASRVVRDIFRMRLEGASASKIAAELNRLGILSPLAYKKNNGLPYAKKGYADKADCKWSATTIIRILQDETYTGTLVQGKQGTPHYKIKQMEQRPASEWVRVPEAHEPLIARQDFELVQRIKGLDTRTSPKEDTVYLFSGILICGCCGSRMTRKTNRAGGKEYHYYYCPTGKKKGCTHPVMLKESSLIACVRDSLKAYIDNVASLETLLADIDQASINQALAKEYSDHITDNERRLEQVLEFKARLYESLVGGMLTKEEYASYKAKYTKQAEDIKESIRVLKEKLTDVLENRSERNRWISQFTQFATLETLDRRALIHMVQSIRVRGKKELDIAFTYEDEYKKALQLIELAAQNQQTEEFEHRKAG